MKHLSQNTYKLSIKKDATVEELKKEIENQSQIKAAEIKLIFKGKILKKNDDTLADLKIESGCTIHMVHNKP